MLKKMLTMTTRVSILILMEVSLVRTITGATMNAMTSFNPYFNGSFSCTSEGITDGAITNEFQSLF